MELVRIENVNGALVTTSNRVAEELGVLHRDLLEKIDGYVAKFGSAEFSAGFYIPSNYVHSQNKQTYRNYLITEKGVSQLIGGYSLAVERAFALNVAYINKFEEMKKELNNQFKVPTSFKEALSLALEQQEQIEKLEIENKVKEQRIEEQKPKVLFAEAVETSKSCILIGELAKILKQNGIDTGQKRMFTWLRENGYLIRRKGSDYNMPTQKAMELALFEIKETAITHSDGHISVNKTVKVTGKGQIYFVNLLKKLKEVV